MGQILTTQLFVLRMSRLYTANRLLTGSCKVVLFMLGYKLDFRKCHEFVCGFRSIKADVLTVQTSSIEY